LRLWLNRVSGLPVEKSAAAEKAGAGLTEREEPTRKWQASADAIESYKVECRA
jgi:hypothetical protein